MFKYFTSFLVFSCFNHIIILLKFISNFAIAYKIYRRKFYSGKLCSSEIEHKMIRI